MLRALRQNRSGFARMLAALALLAMLVRAAVPQGYMFAAPQPGAGFLTVTLCSGHGTQTALLDLASGALHKADSGHGNGGKTAKTDAPCVFAAAAPLAAPGAAPALNAPRLARAAITEAAFAAIPGRGLAAPPPWATGPPTLV